MPILLPYNLFSHAQSHTSTFSVNTTSLTNSQNKEINLSANQTVPAATATSFSRWTGMFVIQHVSCSRCKQPLWRSYIGDDRHFGEGENLLESKRENKAYIRVKKKTPVRTGGCLSGFILSGVSFQLCLIPFIRTWKPTRESRSALFGDGGDLKNNVF